MEIYISEKPVSFKNGDTLAVEAVKWVEAGLGDNFAVGVYNYLAFNGGKMQYRNATGKVEECKKDIDLIGIKFLQKIN